ncbi:MAG: hypothetical protein HOV68_20855, partial [Streptomycetaceae bacterium]|nr:hypothetical protein [Streptomycetaceae bacterium]
MNSPYPPSAPQWPQPYPQGYYQPYPAPAAVAGPPAPPIALPEAAVPPGTRPWTAAAAHTWAAVRAPWWTSAFISLALIAVGVTGCVATSVDAACDQSSGGC